MNLLQNKSLPPLTYPVSAKNMKESRKIFLLFSGSNYYPEGGWNDYRGDFFSIEEAIEFLRRNIEIIDREWYQIVNICSYEVVRSNHKK